jgi:hypothetical protein
VPVLLRLLGDRRIADRAGGCRGFIGKMGAALRAADPAAADAAARRSSRRSSTARRP